LTSSISLSFFKKLRSEVKWNCYYSSREWELPSRASPLSSDFTVSKQSTSEYGWTRTSLFSFPTISSTGASDVVQCSSKR
jgi:hypothetical protein